MPRNILLIFILSCSFFFLYLDTNRFGCFSVDSACPTASSTIKGMTYFIELTLSLLSSLCFCFPPAHPYVVPISPHRLNRKRGEREEGNSCLMTTTLPCHAVQVTDARTRSRTHALFQLLLELQGQDLTGMVAGCCVIAFLSAPDADERTVRAKISFFMHLISQPDASSPAGTNRFKTKLRILFPFLIAHSTTRLRCFSPPLPNRSSCVCVCRSFCPDSRE
jgi:hypothetical protein